ncbi:TonB-dependent receptor [Komagataeibacter diospyri]|nr:TonB-dependent receptor [Komagataeibacter diospyri]
MRRRSTGLTVCMILSSTFLTNGLRLHMAHAGDTVQKNSVNAKSTAASGGKTTAVRAGDSTVNTGINATGAGEQLHVTRTRSYGGLIRNETAAKSVSTVSHDYIAKQAPASNALALVAMSPGANVSMGDPFGVSDESDINVRGLNQQEIGFTFEGAPMNDPDDYTPNSSEWVDSENMDNVQLQQGAPSIETPTTTSSGGTMAVKMRGPKHTRGGEFDVSYGTHQMNRQFIRYDSGDIANTGLRAFASFSDLTSRAWRGPGRNNRWHVDYKLIKEWGDGNYISLSGSYNNEHTAWYSTPTLSDWNKYGLKNNPNDMQGKYSFGEANYYKSYATSWTDYFLSAPSHFKLARNLTLDVTPYYYHGSGNYPFGVTTVPTTGPYYNGTAANSSPLAGNNYSEDGQTAAIQNWIGVEGYTGFNSTLHYKVANHDLVFGYWYGYTDMHVDEPLSGLDASGNSTGYLRQQDGTTLNEWSYHTITQTNALYIGDTMHFLNRKLTLDVGFKEVMAARNGTLNQPGPQYNANYYSAQPLPRMSISYKFNPKIMVFGNVTTSYRLPLGSAFYNQYNSPWDGGTYQTANKNLHDEYSVSEEVGARYHDNWITASLTLFNYNFSHHQINEYIGNVPYYQDAGSMTTRGFDGELALHPWHHITPYGSVEYLYARQDSNITMDGVTYHTAGKMATSAPRWMAAAGLQYDDGRFFGSVSLKYVDKEYGTFMNDEQIAGHKQVDMMIGARAPDIGFLKAPSLRLNVINLADHHYLSGVYNTGPVAGTAQYYTAPNFACLGTFSTGF